MFYFDPKYFVFLGPAMLLMMWAQGKVHSAFRRGMQVPARLSGAAAARYILDESGCTGVGIEQTHGTLSDHYDPRANVLRLSPDVFQGQTAASVGIAAHEAGHALQNATNYAPLVIRNAAVPAAKFGGATAIVLLIAGAFFSTTLVLLGLVAFGCVLFFQLVNLPVEFDASNRAKRLLTQMNIVDQNGAVAVNRVLNAAAWTYVAATLQTALQIAYYAFTLLGGHRDG